MSKKKQKYYVIWEGHKTGIFDNWDECKKQVAGYVGAKFKSFESIKEAEDAFKSSPFQYIIKKVSKPLDVNATPIIPSICVDAACAGVPGPVEYRGVVTTTKKELFKIGPYKDGTNNIGEFLAIVHGLAFLSKKNSKIPIYSDSATAISWIKAKKCKTKHLENETNKPLFDLIRRADLWLINNSFENPILKWPTQQWGEIPADFGRK